MALAMTPIIFFLISQNACACPSCRRQAQAGAYFGSMRKLPQ